MTQMIDLTREPSPLTGTTERIIAILLAFDSNGVGLTLSEVARQVKLPVSTTRRFLGELCDARLLERVDNKYHIGIKFFEIGMRSPLPNRLGAVAAPLMDDLYTATHENVHLGVLDSDGVVIIQQRSGRGSVRNPISKGQVRMPAYATANGKALLAFSDPEVVERVISKGLEPITPKTITDPEKLLSHLDETRERGWSYAQEENSYGTKSVGAPVLDQHRRAVAALSLVVPITHKNVEPYAHAVKTAATTISRLWNQPPMHRNLATRRTV